MATTYSGDLSDGTVIGYGNGPPGFSRYDTNTILLDGEFLTGNPRNAEEFGHLSWNTALDTFVISTIATGAGTARNLVLDSGASLFLRGTTELYLEALKWPRTAGTSGQVLSTDGVDQLSWVAGGGGGGMTQLEDDTAPKLGGDLDTNGFEIITVAGNLVLSPAAEVQFNANITTEAGQDLTIAPATGTVSITQNLLLDTIGELSAGQGVTVDGVLLKDSGVGADAVAEQTPDNGVLVDDVLIKDGSLDGVAITALAKDSVGVTVDGAGQVVATGSKGFVRVFYDCTIDRVTLIADQPGNVEFDIQKSNWAGFPPTVSIVASSPPTLLAAQNSEDATLTGWDTAITAGDVLEFLITGTPATLTRVTLMLETTKT